jgi:hypothetical protein
MRRDKMSPDKTSILVFGLTIGMWIGSNLGVLIMCLLHISPEGETRERPGHSSAIGIAEPFQIEAVLQREGKHVRATH